MSTPDDPETAEGELIDESVGIPADDVLQGPADYQFFVALARLKKQTPEQMQQEHPGMPIRWCRELLAQRMTMNPQGYLYTLH